jgi:hypothetical protein
MCLPVQTDSVNVKRWKSKNYNWSKIARLQPIFQNYHISLKFMCKLYNHISTNFWRNQESMICENFL